MNHYTKDLELFKTYPHQLAQSITGGMQNLAQTHRKALMEIDQKIEAISKPADHIQREKIRIRKNIANSFVEFAILAVSFSFTASAAHFLAAGAAVSTVFSGAAAIGVGITLGAISLIKLTANAVNYCLNRKEEKQLKQEKKVSIQREVLESYEHQSQINCMNEILLSENKSDEFEMPAHLSPVR